ncbi:MAG TPA: DNA helicase PcrA [Firmicutes bacterium]|nr:DNA helicase PcrA [Bacillota bacterium]
MENLLAELNPAQQEAVCHTEGPLLILAGAGSGKTRVLVYRIAYLLTKGVPREHLLAVTFTNKAAEEMRERVGRLVGEWGEAIWISTFHAACLRVLRREGPAIGIPKDFTIFDTQDQLVVVKEVLRELNLSEKNFHPRALLAAISAAKNKLIGPEDYEKSAADFWATTVAKVYPLYQKKLRANAALDFDDLIMSTVRLFQEHPAVLDRYQERFRYIMIDEYQDTNHAQYVLTRLLAAKYRNLCVVGDDDQSIYSFRSADIRNILEFEKDYPEVKIIKLEQNYRSTQHILQAANEVVRHNFYRKQKTLWTQNEPGPPVTALRAADEKEEAWGVISEIERLVTAEGYSLSDCALLYRTNAQSRSFEEVLGQKGLPYQVVGALRFYERKEIRDILAYLRLVHNPQDRVGLRRVINVPRRGIGAGTLERFLTFLDENGFSLLEGLARVGEAPGLTSRAVNALSGFHRFFQGIYEQREQFSVSRLTKEILEESGYLRELREEDTVEARSRLENLDEFLALTSGFEMNSDDKSLARFLEQVALVADVDHYDRDQNGITLMTIHSAKGLEFPVVFLVGMEEGLFPHSRSLMEPAEIEEERRLCYVGMTRAKERLYLTYALIRTMYGGRQLSTPSRFLREVSSLQEISSLQGPSSPEVFRGAPAGPGTGSGPVVDKPVLSLGDEVIHAKWGRGVVVALREIDGDTAVTVAFPGNDLREMLLSLAPLEKVGQGVDFSS